MADPQSPHELRKGVIPLSVEVAYSQAVDGKTPLGSELAVTSGGSAVSPGRLSRLCYLAGRGVS